MNKKDLAKKISKKFKIPLLVSTKIVEFLLDEIAETVKSGDEVSLVGFGKFYPYTHASRPVRNPKTQEAMNLSEYTTIRFRVSQKLKKYLKGV